MKIVKSNEIHGILATFVVYELVLKSSIQHFPDFPTIPNSVFPLFAFGPSPPQEDRRSVENPEVPEAEMGVFLSPSCIQNHKLRDGDVVKAVICKDGGKSMTLG